MTALEKLDHLYKLDELINQKLDQREHYMSMACRITPTLSDMPKAVGGNGDKIGNIAVLISALDDEISWLEDDYINLVNEIKSNLNSMTNRNHVLVLSYRYLNHCKWEDIAIKLNYTIRHTLRLHADALYSYNKRYGDKYGD